MKTTAKRALSLAAALSLMLGLLGGCAPKAEAATMHLKRTEGTVAVPDGEGKGLEPAENLGLYSGYGVDTKGASYAWIDLDEVKLTEMDENSAIEVQKEGKHLAIEVKSGSLFFNVTEPLAEDETMDIRTSTMVVGIRGTCGWVDAEQNRAGLLKGAVVCRAESGAEVTLSAGELAELGADGQFTVTPLIPEDVPAFIQGEAEEDVLPTAEPEESETGSEGGTTSEPEEPRPTRMLYYLSDGTLNDYYEPTYDEQGRIVLEMCYAPEIGLTHYNEYSYSEDGTQTITCNYDTDGTLERRVTYIVLEENEDYIKSTTTIEYPIGTYVTTNSESFTYYDEQGRAIRDEGYTDGQLTVTETYEYDESGLLARITDYDAAGNLIRYTDYRYDDTGRPLRLTCYNAAGEVDYHYEYQYD